MSLGPVKARNFWRQLDNDNTKDAFTRNENIRNSLNNSQTSEIRNPIIYDSIYCTIRNPKNRRSTSVPNQRAVLTTVPTIHYSQSRKMETKTPQDNLSVTKKIDTTSRGPKRYETTCYFKPLAVPVWYSSSVTVQVNSTKKKYTENVTYKKKFVPYRYIERMTTIISSSRPKNFVTNLGVQIEVPEEHIISLEPQQKAVNPLFTTDHSIKVDNYC